MPSETRPRARGIDDFAEHLTDAYAPLIANLATCGVTAQIQRAGTGHYVLTTPDQCVEVLNGTQPLPDTPGQVTLWSVTHSATGRTSHVHIDDIAALADTIRTISSITESGGT